MKMFIIRRRQAWKTGEELSATAARSADIGNNQMADQVRWIRSYVVREPDGTLGTVCVYQAVSEQALREHAERVDMPADEISPVEDTVVVRADPAQEQNAA